MWSNKHGVLFSLVALTGSLLSVPSFADSQARIVRLSDAEGNVQIDRNTGQGYEKASVNLPITQGVNLRVGHDSFAVVEFEDGSALRLTPLTMVSFSQLTLRDSGAKASQVDVRQGMVYISYAGAKDDEFALTFGSQTIKLDKSARLRVAVDREQAIVAMLKGDAQVLAPSGVVELSKKQTISFDLVGNTPYTIAKNIEESPFDAWDKRQQEYSERYANNGSYSGSPYRYGVSDLNYYGNFMNVPGYGMMWQPFFTGAGWDPFMNGVWAFYPGSGYGWASSYPWGWLPYHSGSWMFVPSSGWMWQPGGSWAGLSNLPQTANVPRGFISPRPPATPTSSMIAINRGGSMVPVGNSVNRFVIRNNTAGMGIPRGSIQNLGKMSQQAAQQGFANTKLQPQMVNPALMRAPVYSPAGQAQPGTRSAGRSTGTGSGTPSSQPSYSAPRSSAPSFQPMPSPGGIGGGAGGGVRKGK